MFLTCDIVSVGKGAKVYGRKGDRIKVVSDHGTVFIVEIKPNDGFAVKPQFLTLTKR